MTETRLLTQGNLEKKKLTKLHNIQKLAQMDIRLKCWMIVFTSLFAAFYGGIDLWSFLLHHFCWCHFPPILLTYSISIILFLQWMNQYCYIIINWSPYFSHISLLFTIVDFFLYLPPIMSSSEISIISSHV